MISFVNKLIPLTWKIQTQLFLLRNKPIESLTIKKREENKKYIFIFLAADYGNLGDVAITYAQHKFLSNSFPDHVITEIPISKTIKGIACVERIIKPNDIVTTVGGGNMGDLYKSIEYYRQLVINCFKNNKIISFPQTVDFKDTHKGKKALTKAIKVYSNHPDLTLIAREHKSYDYFKRHFIKNNILLTPDIVLSLNQTLPKFERKGALICLRNDKEKKLTKKQEDSIFKYLSNEFKTVKKRDTHVGGMKLPLKDRVTKLKHIWDDFKKAELVVTDRLHGMIFCYITGTPALVFLNNNHKIKSSYFWINSAPHIRLIENVELKNIKQAITEIRGAEVVIDINLETKYNEITKTVKA
ncbi:polysaccharide pyruvyl transferase family protein [Hwangdonia seohaensis]|uniref:Polysaccharide pyruvyl transferase family protein n=1 Tax=Hwangdonia seohaensis TaxID=1240727 RepID=A0ABW3RBY5_9FLAO